ncbi:MAG TPA: ectonucleotide pyrophosphatase/phosphodiesterase [Cyclobacteriaceae bacterium]
MKRFFLFAVLLISQAAYAQKNQTPYVLLVSFDGFRYDYVSKYNLPHFKELIKQGASAEAMIPSFPSKTFPNHYTIVTGLYPGHHGLVDNQFYDPKLKSSYGMKDPGTVTNSAFYGGTPLWQLTQQNGMKSASYFWVGSETQIQGKFPDYYFKFDDDFPNGKRVDQVVDWLALPEADRPHFISLYFSLVDHAGHDFGPGSKETQQAVMTADSLLGNLMDKLKSIKLPVNLIVVSDHGMVELKQEESTYVTLNKLFDVRDKSVIFANGGTQTHLYTNKPDSLYDVLKKQENHYKVYKRNEFPPRWHYDVERAGDLMIVADLGYYIQVAPRNFEKNPPKSPVFGVHGYDPAEIKDTHAIFYAMGPNIKSGITIPTFENIHVYPFIAKILGLKTPKVDGEVKVLEDIYKK